MTAGTRRRRLRPVPGLCSKCGNRAYRSRRSARIAALIWNPSSRMIAYPHRGWWHLSSETPRDPARRKGQAA